LEEETRKKWSRLGGQMQEVCFVLYSSLCYVLEVVEVESEKGNRSCPGCPGESLEMVWGWPGKLKSIGLETNKATMLLKSIHSKAKERNGGFVVVMKKYGRRKGRLG
jgi:hypothetical protein